MAVVVQQMVVPHAAGVLFTADPVTSNRKVASVEATFGLGEALVSGLVNADVYKVRDGEVVARAVATKQLAIHASPAGGTQQAGDRAGAAGAAGADRRAGRAARAAGPADRGALRPPQDIEWCLVDDGFQVVQSRPITTLFPIPAAGDDGEPRLRLRRPPADDDRPHEAPGALRVAADGPPADARGRREAVRRRHRRPGLAGEPRRLSCEVLGSSDPLIRDALQTVLERGDFIPSLPDDGPGGRAAPAARRPRSRPIRPSSPS